MDVKVCKFFDGKSYAIVALKSQIIIYEIDSKADGIAAPAKKSREMVDSAAAERSGDMVDSAATQKSQVPPNGVRSEPVNSLSAPKVNKSKTNRYIPRAVRHLVWERDGGVCCKCSSRRNLHLDHIIPVALGGRSTQENLWVLCSNCNQREAIKVFGTAQIERIERKTD